MELLCAFSIVFREQNTFEPLFLMSGHLHHEVITVNERSTVPVPHAQTMQDC